MKRKPLQHLQLLSHKEHGLLEELRTTEQEFGELITDKWELVQEDAELQKKALAGAKRLKELRLMLITHRFLHRTIQ